MIIVLGDIPWFLHPSSLTLACRSVLLCISCGENSIKRTLFGSLDKSSGFPSPPICVFEIIVTRSLHFITTKCWCIWTAAPDWIKTLLWGAEHNIMILVSFSLPLRVAYPRLQPFTEHLCCIHCGTFFLGLLTIFPMLLCKVQYPSSHSADLY